MASLILVPVNLSSARNDITLAQFSIYHPKIDVPSQI